jgi:aspartate/methionine/tyrosine aminotransferase
LLIFVSPSNPTGAVYPPEQVAEIGRWAAEHGIWVMTDEIYEHLVYGEMPFTSIASDPAAAERTVIVNGVSKSYAMTGWRVGWMVGPLPVIKAATRLQSHAASNAANVSQVAALEALTGTQEPLTAMQAAFSARRDLMYSMLGEIPGVKAIAPEGAFYAFPDVRDMLGRDLRGRSAATDMELAAMLLEEIKIAVVPGEAFGAPGYVRLSFALGDDDIREGLERWKAYASA